MIKFLLSLFKPFRGFIEKMGADYNQFIRILQLKLTMDNRRTKGIGANANKETENALIKQSFFQLMIGVGFAMLFILVKSPFTFYFLFHSLLMAMMAMTIIAEFTTILFDTSENVIIQPLPIKGNTISLARNAHVLTYLSLIAFNLSVVTIITAGFKFGVLSALIFSFTILLNMLFTLFLANILYLLIMRIASGEKLKNILMYFQIVIAILFMGGYQLSVNMVDKTQLNDLTLAVHWYTYLIPPAFFSGLVDAFTIFLFDTSHLIFIAESLVIPVLAIYLTGKYLTPVFNRKLMDLEQGDRVSKIKTKTVHRSLWYRAMMSIFVHRKAEHAPFRLVWTMTGRERLFMQSFLPTLGFIVIMIAVQFFRNNSFNMEELVQSNRYLLILYSFMFIGLSLPSSLLYGNNTTATWIFKTLPLSRPADYFKGFIKAAFARFFMPFYLFLSVGICILWGYRVIPDVLVAILAIYFVTSLFYYLQNPGFPFSQSKAAAQGGMAFVKVMGLMIIAAALGFMHYFVSKWSVYAPSLLILLYLSLVFYINRVLVYRKISWEAVDSANQ